MDDVLPSGQIYLVLDSRRFGGIETYVHLLAYGLQQRGLQVQVVFLNNYGLHPLHSILDEHGITHISLDGRYASLQRLIKSDKPLLIHSHGYKANLYSKWAARGLGIPIVCHYHAGEPGDLKVRFYTWLDRITASMSSNIAVNKSIANRVHGATYVINNFVNVPTDQASISQQHTPLRIAFVGRLSHEKGPDLFCQLAKICTDQQFILYGDGPMMDNLVEDKQLNIEFKGAVTSMDHHWHDIDILCISSRYEGLPLTVLEAMARGILVIAFDVGSINNVITTADNGYIVAANNINAMNNSIEDYRKLSAEQKAQMAHKAKSTISEHYSSEVTIPKVIKVYESALAGDIQ